MNKFNLGIDLTQEQSDALWEVRAEDGLHGCGRRVEEYWNVRDMAIPFEDAEALIRKAYNIKEKEFFACREGAFITPYIELATEMMRVLNMDFVHDFKTGLFIMDNYANHEITMSAIYEAQQKNQGFSKFEECAEKYVSEGLGCFQSGARPWIWLGEGVAIPSCLKQFRDKIRRM